MWTAGRAGAHWILLLPLIGCILADVRHGPLASSLEWRSTGEESGESVCRARDWREVEAGYFQLPVCAETRWGNHLRAPGEPKPPDKPSVTVSATFSSSSSVHTSTEHELDTDSPLDNVNFLSFEDWKKQNLAKAGQSAETVGNRGADEAGKENRRRLMGIDNALDSLGEDAEIELDFGGFGAGSPEQPTAWAAGDSSNDALGTGSEGKEVDAESVARGPAGAEAPRARDAGTTCKERFNYASFDCAATVLKTNPECQGSSSVLTENKDSYMLNECRARNKFLILELCEDILVDTVVLANYEFFSSIFHTFRVSVADRYPAKADQWKELGVYEARNTREVQAFAVENPLIWARYLKIELLTHYGSEFYCPLSLIRVHGTTMLEEYKHDGDVAGAAAESIEAGTLTEIEGSDTGSPGDTEATQGKNQSNDAYDSVQDVCPNPQAQVEHLLKGSSEPPGECSVQAAPVKEGGAVNANPPSQSGPPASNVTDFTDEPAPVDFRPETLAKADDNQKPPGHTVNTTSTATTTTVPDTTQRNTTSEPETKSVTPQKEEQSASPESTRSSTTQPPTPNPTTQESFFKSVNKRLQMLESNSTLSLLYIEEQSRILRDAFNKVEKRQLAKTSTFLENLNVTVHNELRQFREQYDQVWKSVAFEFEHQRMQYHQEIHTLSSQFGVLADELVFQKRVSVIQSLVVLFCFGLVLFSRSAVSSYIELPSVQNMVARSYSLRSSSPTFGSMSGSPASTRPGSSRREDGGHRRNLSDDSQGAAPSPTIAYSPPTPAASSSSEEAKMDRTQEEVQAPDPDPPQFRSKSTPPVLRRINGDAVEEETRQSLGQSDMGGPLQ